jgi:hypothetical protein
MPRVGCRGLTVHRGIWIFDSSMKKTLWGGVLLSFLAASACAQPPDKPQPPKAAAKSITLEELTREAGGPALVTLNVKEVPFRQVFVEITRQTGVPIRGGYWDGERDKKAVTLSIEKQPFWTAMREVGAKLDLYPQQWGMQNGLVLSQDSDGRMRGATQFSHPLMTMMVKSISRTHNVELRDPDTTKVINGPAKPGVSTAPVPSVNMTLEGMVLVDPKLRLMPGMGRAKLTEIIDEKNQSLKSENEIYFYGESPLLWNMQVPLTYRATMGKKIAHLRGSVKFFVVSRSEKWEITDVMKAKGAKKTVKTLAGEETYTLSEAVQEGESYRFKLDVARPQVIARPVEENTPEGQQLLAARRDLNRWARLEDDKGRTFWPQGGGGADDSVTMQYGEIRQFPGDEKLNAPHKMVIEIPLEFRELEVPFDFKDLPLP